ncbi:hypothetical protein [uncultured Robinsoniella sp.]|uniref:hypothetical protein n=1 Tax=uncultured Robinsoniella sp. TaxID=904190 RepID=UPI00374F578B
MKKELPYFNIGDSFGGNQDWFHNFLMHMGGCAAATACDSCIYFALHRDFRVLYPFDVKQITKEDYEAFAMKMKPYLRPRAGGIKKTSIYIDGFGEYLKSLGEQDLISMEGFSGDRSFEESASFIVDRIDQGYPIPYLMLKHTDCKFKDYSWHWFLLVGYEQTESDVLVTLATYGKATVFSLRELWHTGYEEKGGMIRYQLNETV